MTLPRVRLVRRCSACVFVFCAFVTFITSASAQLAWMRADKDGVAPAGSGTRIRFRIPAGERVTFFTSGFPQLTLSAPGVSAQAALAFSIEGDIGGLENGNDLFFAMGLFNTKGTTPPADFSDDSGYFVQLRGITADSTFVELCKRLGNGKSPALLNPSDDASARLNATRVVYSGGSLTELVQYQLVFCLARTAQGVAFGEGREPGSAGVWISGGGMNVVASTREPDARPETVSFNQFGIFFYNSSSQEIWLNIDSLHLEMRKDGERISITTRPRITAQPEGVTVIAGKPLVLAVEAVGAAVAYQWKRNGELIPGATRPKLEIAASELDDAGAYTVEIFNPYGDVVSDPANVVVKQLIRVRPNLPPGAELVFDESAVDVKPVAQKAVRVRYPPSLRKRNVEGESVLRFVVTREGYVDGLEVVSCVDKEAIDALVAAYEGLLFDPGTKDGKRVNVRVKVAVPYPPKK